VQDRIGNVFRVERHHKRDGSAFGRRSCYTIHLEKIGVRFPVNADRTYMQVSGR